MADSEGLKEKQSVSNHENNQMASEATFIERRNQIRAQLLELVRNYKDLQLQYQQYRTDVAQAPVPASPAPAGDQPYQRWACCWRCGQQGHLRSNCPNPLQLFCSFCGTHGRLSRDCPCHNQENSTASSSSSSDPSPTINVSIYSRTFQALLDTGSSTSFMGNTVTEWFKAHGQLPDATESAAILTNGSIAPLGGRVDADIQIGDRNIQHPLTVMPNLTEDLLFGMDIMARLQLMLDIREDGSVRPEIPAIDNEQVQEMEKDGAIEPLPSVQISPSVSKNSDGSPGLGIDFRNGGRVSKKSVPRPGTTAISPRDNSSTTWATIVIDGVTLRYPTHIPKTSRRYRIWTENGRWVLRWDKQGHLRTVRKMD